MRSSISVLGLALLLSACGGRGGSSSTPPTGGAPAPAPTPAPSPTPAPAPTPTPSASTDFYASMGVPLISRVIWDTNESGVFGDQLNGTADLVTATNRAGEFGRNAVGRQSVVEPLGDPSSAIQIGGVSAQTGFIYTRITAPRGASVVTPVTSLFQTIDDDAAATNLGLNFSAAELAKFNAVSALSSSDDATKLRARKVVALNLKLLAQAGLETTETGSTTQAIIVGPNLYAVRAQVQSAPVDFNSQASIGQILARSKRAERTSDAGRAAAAKLLATYGTAVDEHLAAGGRVADIEYALRINILPQLNGIFNTSAPTAGDLLAAESSTVADLRSLFAEHTEIALIPSSTGEFVAVPDRVSMIGLRFMTFPAACSNPASFVCNDVTLSASGPLNANTIAIDAVRVPAKYSGVISAQMTQDGAVRVDLLQTTTRIVWIEYDARDREGKTSTARAYILVGQE